MDNAQNETGQHDRSKITSDIKTNLRRMVGWPFYPWLVTLYPIIYLFSINLTNVREDDVIEVALIALIISTILYAAGYLLIRDAHQAGAITSVVALVFLTYGHVLNVLDSRYSEQTFLMPTVLVLLTIVIVVILRTKMLWGQLAPYLNAMLVVLLIMPVWQIVVFNIGKPGAGDTGRANPYERSVLAPTVNNNAQRPDIYYIILDGYSSNAHWAREFDYDNSPFTDALTERGFYVAHDSRVNYATTIVSLPSSLNMRYITEDDRALADQNAIPARVYLRSLIANNRVAYELKQMGYEYHYVLSGYLAPSTLADVNIAFYADGTEYFKGSDFQLDGLNGAWAYEQPFLPFFLETTLLTSMASRFEVEEPGRIRPRYSPVTVLKTFEELERIPEMEAATFTFAHILKPHLPVQFDRDGNIIEVELDDYDPAKPAYFFDELYFLNNRVIELVDYLLAESSIPPIIIIQADHGSYLGNPSPEMGDWRYFEILNALYLPGEQPEDLTSSIAPVNTFRLMFNTYFGGDYELLESEQYLVPRGWSDGDYFTYVHYIDDRRLNRGLGDHIALIYDNTDDSGVSELQINAVLETGKKGELLLSISPEDVEDYINNPPAENTLIAREGPVAFYAITSGEFQFNLGLDAQGNEWAVVMHMFPPRIVHGYQVGAN